MPKLKGSENIGSTEEGLPLPKVLYVSMHDPADVKAWSGTVYFISRMLARQGFPMEYMGNMLLGRRLIEKAIEHTRARLLGRKPAPIDRRIHTAERCARAIEERLLQSDAQVVFSPGSIPLARLGTSLPKVFQTDATFAGIIDQYPELADYPKEYIEEGHRLEHEALHNCDLAIYSSQWAARSAIEDYGADPAKVKVIPFGSNLGVDPALEEVEEAISLRSTKECVLLFVGVHWQRKGGDVAMAAAARLHEMGLKVRLHIIGCIPPVEVLPPYVHVEPFMDKRKPEELAQLVETIRKSHFLILPSQADCTPIVVNECNSLGVPCLTSDVGGLPEMIKEGRNGHMFTSTASGDEYAATIMRYMNDRERYAALARGAFHEHQEWLGWQASGALVRKAIMELVHVGARS